MYYTIYNFRICRHYTDTEQVSGWRDYNHLQGWKELGIDSDYDYYLNSVNGFMSMCVCTYQNLSNRTL